MQRMTHGHNLLLRVEINGITLIPLNGGDYGACVK
jgi:hypothetical protein